MKYVMLKVYKPVERLVPVIFPDQLVHSVMADALQKVLEQHGWGISTVESAGEVTVEASATIGHSESLGVKACESDKRVINSYGYLHGIVP
jgi:hypothetical protein